MVGLGPRIADGREVGLTRQSGDAAGAFHRSPKVYLLINRGTVGILRLVGALDLVFGPDEALLGVAADTDQSVARVERKGGNDDKERFHEQFFNVNIVILQGVKSGCLN